MVTVKRLLAQALSVALVALVIVAAWTVAPRLQRIPHDIKVLARSFFAAAPSVNGAAAGAPKGDAAVGATTGGACAAGAPATILVAPSAVTRVIPADFFGINEVGFWDTAQGSAASARALAQTPIRTVRFPGGAPADWYDWQQPYYKGWSSTAPRDLWRYARSFGATRVVFETNYQGHLPNPPGRSYAVNSPANAAAWVADNRAAGRQADMEVGNEEDMTLLHSADDPAYGAYVAAFNAQARAMHRADPGARVLGPTGTNEYQWWALDGLGAFLQGAGNRSGTGQVDGVSLHFYKGSSWFDARGVAQYWLAPGGPWAAIERMIRQHDTRQLPVYITEWNIGVSSANNSFNATLGHALATADMVGAFARSGVAGEDYFTTHGANGWGLLYGPGESRPVDSPTPTYYAMALWGHMGPRLVDLAQSADAGTVLSAYATTRADGSVQVLAINKRRATCPVRVVLDGATPRGHRLRVYSLRGAAGGVQALDALYDGAVMPTPRQPLPGPRDAGLVRGDSVVYSVPAYSAVVLDLSGTSPAPRLSAARRRQLIAATGPATPETPLKVTASGGVGQASLTGGAVQTLTATVRANDDVGPALVDLEVYGPGGVKVFQSAPTVSLSADTPISVTEPFTLPANATGGTYYYKLGVFPPGWGTPYAYVDAGRFTVKGPPPVAVSVTGSVAPAVVQSGQAATVTVTVTVSALHNSLLNALVDVEVYSASGAKLCQPTTPNVDVAADSSRQVTARCAVPVGTAIGSYTVKIGVFGSTWSPLYAWNNSAGAFAVAR